MRSSSPWPVAEALIGAAGGRRLEVFAAGPASGGALVLLHGTPGCGLLAPWWVSACAERGMRLVGYSRPGYGRSTRHPGRTVADCARDVEALAGALGLTELLVAGHSGGGSHALACAAELPGLVRSAAVLSGAAPRDAEGLDWLAGQDADNVEEHAAAVEGGERLERLLEVWRAELLAPEAEFAGMGGRGEEEVAAEPFGAMVSPADRAATTPEGSAFAAARRRHALAPGIWGWYDDDLTETRAWGFDLAAIRVPVAVWHGGQDGFVPFAHGEWLAAHVPGAVARLDPGEGHFSVLERRFADVVDDLLALAGG